MEKKLYRDEQNGKIAGVCAGLAEYLNVDVTVIRVIFAIALIMKGVGVVPYIVMWVVLPKKNPFTQSNVHVDYTVPPVSNPFASGPQNAANPFTATGAPFAMPPKKKSSAGLIVGIGLVLFGSYFLLDNFDILPDLDLERLWPIAIIILGASVVLSGKTKPWEKADWHKTEAKEEQVFTEEKPAEENNPTV